MKKSIVALAALAATAVGFAAYRRQRMADAIGEGADTWAAGVSDAAAKAAGGVSKAADATASSMGKVADKAADAAANAGTSAQGIANKAAAAVDTAAQSAADATSQLADRADKAAGKVSDTSGKVADVTAERAAGAADKVHESVAELNTELDEAEAAAQAGEAGSGDASAASSDKDAQGGAGRPESASTVGCRDLFTREIPMALLFNPSQYEAAALDGGQRRRPACADRVLRGQGPCRDEGRAPRRHLVQRLLGRAGGERHLRALRHPAEAGALVGSAEARWDTTGSTELNEILAFYSLSHWYAWQVTVLGLGPVWTSGNSAAQELVAELLADGAVFGFGLSEQTHGADIYSTDMVLTRSGDGWVASGPKYYIGNGNVAGRLSVFGRFADDDPDYPGSTPSSWWTPATRRISLRKNVVASQMYVAAFDLDQYPVEVDDLLHTGKPAWDAALATVNVGKANLGWASIGICEHAFYEAVAHANNRVLYGTRVTEFPHVRRMLADAYARLIAMKMYAARATDYMRSANADDRRYLLFNPLTKMKVTGEGERVIDLLWDVIAARGFEEDTYFEQAATHIRALPKLEGTVAL